MPNNIEKLLRNEFKKLTDQATGKVQAKAKNKAGNKLYADLKRSVKGGDDRDFEQIIAGPIADIHAQVSRRLLELLNIDTTKDTGRLNGGWTSGSAEVHDRLNKTSFTYPDELGRILRHAEGGHEIDIRNAIEYAAFVNYGTGGAEARAFVETSLAQLVNECAKMGLTLTITGG